MRVLLAGMSNMLLNIVTAAIDQLPDSVVVGRADESEGVARQLRATNADVVVLQDTHPDQFDSFVPLLRRFPALRVVAITPDGGIGYLHELRPHSIYLAELSVSALKTALFGGHDRAIN